MGKPYRVKLIQEKVLIGIHKYGCTHCVETWEVREYRSADGVYSSDGGLTLDGVLAHKGWHQKNFDEAANVTVLSHEYFEEN